MKQYLVLTQVVCVLLAAPAAAQHQTIQSSQSVQTVPSVIGMDVESAKHLLAERLDLKTTVRLTAAAGVRDGIVVDQNPRGGSPVPKNRTVDLHVSSSRTTSSHDPKVKPIDVLVPAVAAIGILLSRSRRHPPKQDTAHPPTSTPPSNTEQPVSPVAPAPEPAAPESPPVDAERTPTRGETDPVSEPPPRESRPTDVVPAATTSSAATVVMPSLVRQSISAAVLQITHVGLLADEKEIARDSAGGYVLGQNPEAGVVVPVGTLVRLNRGVRVPQVEGMSLDSADMMVRASQLRTSRASTVVGSAAVLSQRPAAGEIVSPGTVVELDAVPPPRPASPINVSVILIILLLLLAVAAGTVARKRRTARVAYHPPVIRPEAHRDLGRHHVSSKRDLVGKTEIRLAARGGRMQSALRSEGSIVTDDRNG